MADFEHKCKLFEHGELSFGLCSHPQMQFFDCSFLTMSADSKPSQTDSDAFSTVSFVKACAIVESEIISSCFFSSAESEFSHESCFLLPYVHVYNSSNSYAMLPNIWYVHVHKRKKFNNSYDDQIVERQSFLNRE